MLRRLAAGSVLLAVAALALRPSDLLRPGSEEEPRRLAKRGRRSNRAGADSQHFPASFVGSCHGKPPVKKTTCATLQPNAYQRIVAKMSQLYEGLPEACTEQECKRADFVGCVLRFAGHDFMDFDPFQQTGGSDGCLDFNDPDNKGLMPCLVGEGEHGAGATLQAAYADFCEEVSLADFVVLSAEALILRSRPDWTRPGGRQDLDLELGFRFGRPTSGVCWPGTLPNPEDSCQAVEANFVNALGLDWTEATALMGVHTIGKASPENSGYSGFWNAGLAARSFNNSYYIFLMAAGWGAQKLPSGKSQWVRVDAGPSTEMMLNTDMCLLFDTPNHCNAALDDGCCLWLDEQGLNGTHSLCQQSGEVTQVTCCQQVHTHHGVVITNTCTHESDPSAKGASPAGRESAKAVRVFARDERAWLEAFKPAWRKATQNNMHGLLFNPLACQLAVHNDTRAGLPGSAALR